MKADQEFISQLTKRICEVIKECPHEETKEKLDKLLDDIIYFKKL